MEKHKKGILSFLLGILLIILLLYFSDTSELKRILNVNPFYLALVLVSSFVMYLFVAIRWGFIVNTFVGHKVGSTHHYYYYFLLSRTLAHFVPKDLSDFGVRSILFKFGKHISLKESFSFVFIDRMFDLLSISLFMIPSLLFIFDFISLDLALILILIIFPSFLLIFITYNKEIINSFFNMFNLLRKLFIKITKKEREISPVVFNNYNQITDKFVAYLYTLSVLKFLAMVARLYFVALALDIKDLSYSVILLCLGPVQLSYILSFTPAGLGISDFGWYLVLDIVGINNADIILFIISQRVFIFISLIILTALSHFIIMGGTYFKKA